VEHEHRWRSTWLGSDRLLARNVAQPVARFLRIEAASGVLLLLAALVAVVWANSGWSASYTHLLEAEAGISIGGFHLEMSVQEWINDGLMAIFFFVAGLEIKREMVVGELSDRKAAAGPVLAAVGGMIVPALIYFALNAGTAGAKGWGIPMATDIAFAVGIVSLLGPRVPAQLKLFLLTLAVADDLGAIGVIAVAYSQSISFAWLAGSVACLVVVYLMRRSHVWFMPGYVVLGVLAWYFMLRSGVHATVAGVAMGFLTPVTALHDRFDAQGIADRLENRPELTAADVRNAAFEIKEAVPIGERLADLLVPWASFVIIPIFALANAGVPLSGGALSSALDSRVMLGVLLGLVVGKTVGVCGMAYLTTKLGIAKLPRGATFLHMLGISMAAGIGFTVAIFVTGLAFQSQELQDQAKIGIFAASFIAAILSGVVLSIAARRSTPEELAIDAAEDAALFAEEPPAQVIPG